MISFQLNKPSEECGIFWVFRKDVTLRITVDARRGNQKLLLPSPTRLASAAATSEVRCDQNGEFEFGAQDIANCFHQLSIPPGLLQMFGLMPTTAALVGALQDWRH